MGFRFGIAFGDNGGRLSVCIGSRKFVRASEGFDRNTIRAGEGVISRIKNSNCIRRREVI